MHKDLNEQDLTWFKGLMLSIVKYDQDCDRWIFDFGDETQLIVSCPWRIISQGHNAFGGSDHGHQFGLPAPIDGESETLALLGKKSVRDVEVFAETADITIWFEGGQRLEVFNNSSGYEGWDLMGPKGFKVIALGGGALAVWDAKKYGAEEGSDASR